MRRSCARCSQRAGAPLALTLTHPNPNPDPNPEPTPTPTQVAVLQQTIDDQSQQIKALEAAVEALRNIVCIMAGLVVVIL